MPVYQILDSFVPYTGFAANVTFIVNTAGQSWSLGTKDLPCSQNHAATIWHELSP